MVGDKHWGTSLNANTSWSNLLLLVLIFCVEESSKMVSSICNMVWSIHQTHDVCHECVEQVRRPGSAEKENWEQKWAGISGITRVFIIPKMNLLQCNGRAMPWMVEVVMHHCSSISRFLSITFDRIISIHFYCTLDEITYQMKILFKNYQNLKFFGQ